jgi:hypothetical protein
VSTVAVLTHDIESALRDDLAFCLVQVCGSMGWDTALLVDNNSGNVTNTSVAALGLNLSSAGTTIVNTNLVIRCSSSPILFQILLCLSLEMCDGVNLVDPLRLSLYRNKYEFMVHNGVSALESEKPQINLLHVRHRMRTNTLEAFTGLHAGVGWYSYTLCSPIAYVVS